MVKVGGWLWGAGEEICIAIGRAFAIFQGVEVGGLKFQPAPTLAMFSKALWSMRKILDQR